MESGSPGYLVDGVPLRGLRVPDVVVLLGHGPLHRYLLLLPVSVTQYAFSPHRRGYTCQALPEV